MKTSFATTALVLVALNAGAVPSAEDEAAMLDGAFLGVVAVDVADIELSVRGRPIEWPRAAGVVAVRISGGSPAEKLGITDDTLIDVVNGQRIKSRRDFLRAVGTAKPGDMVKLRASRPIISGGTVKWRRKILTAKLPTKLEVIESQVVRKSDPATGITVVRHKDMSKYVNDDSGVDIEIRLREGTVTPVLQVKYVAKDWLFIRSGVIVSNGARFNLPFSSDDVHRDNSTHIWEWFEMKPASDKDTDSVIELMRVLGRSVNAQITLGGPDYRKDRDLYADELDRLQVMWSYYLALTSGRAAKR